MSKCPFSHDTMRETYFHSLAVDELRNIVDFVNRTEYNSSQRQLLPLLFGENRNSAFSPVSRDAFKLIRVHGKAAITCLQEEQTLELGCIENIDLIERILQVCGSSIESIEIGSSSLHITKKSEENHGLFQKQIERYAKLLCKYCTNATKLVTTRSNPSRAFQNAVTILIEGIRTQLEEIRVEDYWLISPIDGLRSSSVVEMMNSNTSKLRHFRYHGYDLGYLEPLWSNVGNSLEQLEIYSLGNGWRYLLNDVKQNCRKLSKVEFENPLVDSDIHEDDLISFLSSYGSNLMRTSIPSGISLEGCKQIVKNCPNMLCSLNEEERNGERISIFQEHIEKLRVVLGVSGESTGLMHSISRCSKLTELSLVQRDHYVRSSRQMTMDEEEVEQLRNLSTLRLHWCSLLPFISFGYGTAQLRKLFVGCEPACEASVFKRLVDENHNRLEHVEIIERTLRKEDETVELATKLVAIFQQCKELENFVLLLLLAEIPPESRIRTMFLPFRYRVRVKFQGKNY